MADIESLGYKSISEMYLGEGVEFLAQIRANRLAPVKQPKKKTTKAKKLPEPNLDNMSLEQLEKLLKTATGGKND